MSDADVNPSAQAEAPTTVGGETSGLAGRFLIHARGLHFVSDARAAAGGPGEAIQAGELLLASLASCGLSLVQKEAGLRGVALPHAEAKVSFQRDPQDGTRYSFIRIDFVLHGVDQALGQALVDAFTGACPIYNTLRRGGPIEATVAVRPAA
jgi:uncharacterized OsmC-like protein